MVNGICAHEGAVCKYQPDADRIEQLKTENGTLKAKLAEYERRVREGELIRVHVAENYVQELVKSIANEFGYNHHLCAETLIDDLKGYAASKQKEGGE
jgi:cell division septum initiation protein DivIVA